MVILAGSIRIGEGKREAALAPMREMVESTRGEPGCREYSFAFDVLDDHLVRIFEIFDDDAALAAHRASPHMARWRARMLELAVSGRDISEYKAQSARKV